MDSYENNWGSRIFWLVVLVFLILVVLALRDAGKWHYYFKSFSDLHYKVKVAVVYSIIGFVTLVWLVILGTSLREEIDRHKEKKWKEKIRKIRLEKEQRRAGRRI